ncbi:MAG: hypothetical protein R6V53_06085 [Candidatus Woesearchaeota archaeon]
MIVSEYNIPFPHKKEGSLEHDNFLIRKDATKDISLFLSENNKMIYISAYHKQFPRTIFLGTRMEYPKGYRVFSDKEMLIESDQEICDSVMVAARQAEKVLLVIDMSILDPVFSKRNVPSEQGGLTPRELQYYVYRIKNLSNLNHYIIQGEPNSMATIIRHLSRGSNH